MRIELPQRLQETGWNLTSRLGNGGQSYTFLIENGEMNGLLKVPSTKNLSKEQLFRFKQEAEALKMLDGRGTPRVLDYSSEQGPYILMEYIMGNTLSQVVNGKPLTPEIAIQILKRLVKIVELVHEIGLQHRDIKPDNILVDENGNVILIDFGLCHFKEEQTEYFTPPDKELGNRFLRLPEYAKGRSISTPVSDVTFLTGILYYMLTAKQPNLLLDESGQMPHRRSNVQNNEGLERWMIYTFDKGFSYMIAQRFQTASDLVYFIENQRNKNVIMSDKEPLTNLTYYLNSPHLKKLSDIKAMILQAHEIYCKSAQEQVTGEIYLYTETGVHVPSGYGVTVNCSVNIVNDNSVSAPFVLTTYVNKELTSIFHEYESDDGGIVYSSYEVSEKARLQEEYKELGILRVNSAMQKLLTTVKALHERGSL